MSSLPAPLSWAKAGAAINVPPSKIAARIFISPLLRFGWGQFNLRQVERQRRHDADGIAKGPQSSQLAALSQRLEEIRCGTLRRIMTDASHSPWVRSNKVAISRDASRYSRKGFGCRLPPLESPMTRGIACVSWPS